MYVRDTMAVNGTYDFLFRRLNAMQPLRKGLDAYATRQKVQAANIANSETPGYRARRVEFEEDLQRALRTTRTSLTRTNGEHIPMRGNMRKMDQLRHQVTLSDAPARLNGVNNVDIDREMSDMATNQIQFATASKVLGMRYRMLKGAIRGQMSGV